MSRFKAGAAQEEGEVQGQVQRESQECTGRIV